MDLMQDKAQLRMKLREIRQAITPEKRKRYEDDIAERLYSLPAVKNANVIGVYSALGSEASVVDLVKALRLNPPGPTIAYPVIHGDGLMTFFAIEPGMSAVFVDNPAQVVPLESLPKDGIVRASSIDLLLVPGVGFDEKCRRLGQGGGYYDRFLPSVKDDCIVVGVAFDEQICEAIPTGPHDRKVDYVVTPTRIIRK